MTCDAAKDIQKRRSEAEQQCQHRLARDEDSENVDVEVRFVGGFVGRSAHQRPVQTYEQLSNYKELVARVEQLIQEKKSQAQIAETLNAEGYRPPKRATSFNGHIV